MFSSKELFVDQTLWQVIGFRTDGIFSAIFLPLILTMILFLGPLSVQMASGIWNIYSGEENFGTYEKIKIFVIVIWLAYFKNLLWLRNHLVAPLSEELVFRSCMIPILLQSFSPMTSIYITPMFFGVGKKNTFKLKFISKINFSSIFSSYAPCHRKNSKWHGQKNCNNYIKFSIRIHLNIWNIFGLFICSYRTFRSPIHRTCIL
jgi:hypothetical protein